MRNTTYSLSLIHEIINSTTLDINITKYKNFLLISEPACFLIPNLCNKMQNTTLLN